MARQNSIEVKDDVVVYATRYGLEALGYAILDLVKRDELHLTSKDTTNIWEYGGNVAQNLQ